MKPPTSVLDDSLMKQMVVNCVELFRADSQLNAWCGESNIYRGRELAPVAGCTVRHIVVAPATIAPEPTANSEDEAEFGLGALIVYPEPFRALDLTEDGAEDVVERIMVVIGSDPTLQVINGGTPLAQPPLNFPLVDQEPTFPDPAAPLGWQRVDWTYTARLDWVTRASKL